MPRTGAPIAALALAALTGDVRRQAQEWPTRPVTMVVPFAAGGPVDVLGRILAQYLGEDHRQASDRGQCAWRRRHDRVAARLPGGARWLHVRAGARSAPMRSIKRCQEAAVQRRHRFRARSR